MSLLLRQLSEAIVRGYCQRPSVCVLGWTDTRVYVVAGTRMQQMRTLAQSNRERGFDKGGSSGRPTTAGARLGGSRAPNVFPSHVLSSPPGDSVADDEDEASKGTGAAAERRKKDLVMGGVNLTCGAVCCRELQRCAMCCSANMFAVLHRAYFEGCRCAGARALWRCCASAVVAAGHTLLMMHTTSLSCALLLFVQ